MTKEQCKAMGEMMVCRECGARRIRQDGFCSDVCRDEWEGDFAEYSRKPKTLGDILIGGQRQMLAWKGR